MPVIKQYAKERNTKFTPEQWAAITREATLTGFTASDVIRRAVEIAYLAKPAKKSKKAS